MHEHNHHGHLTEEQSQTNKEIIVPVAAKSDYQLALESGFIPPDTTIKEWLGRYYSKEEINQLINGVITFSDLIVKSLVNPIISVIWTLYKNNGTTSYTPSLSTSKNIIVDKGVKANVNATYKYTFNNINESLPEQVNGSFGNILPGANVNSTPLTINNIETDNNYNVNLSKPKTGLIVINNQVIPALGNDITTDNISISFKDRFYLINSSNPDLSGTDISNIINGLAAEYSKLINGLVTTFNNVTAGISNYTYLIHSVSQGNITQVYQNDVTPVFGSFIYLSDVTIINPAGLSVNVKRFRTNDPGSFNNVKITTI